MGSGIYIIPRVYDFLSLSGGTVTGNTVFTQNLTATTFYSGSTPLQTAIYNIASQFSSSTLTFSAGNNLFVLTSNTYPNITYGVNDSIYISGNISGGTIFSGGTNIQDIFILSGINLNTGITIFEQKLNNNLLFNTIFGSGQTTVSKSGNRITFYTPSTTIPNSAYIWTAATSPKSYRISNWSGDIFFSQYSLLASNGSFIAPFSDNSGILLGSNNFIARYSYNSTILGGRLNKIYSSPYGNIIGGKNNILGKYYGSPSNYQKHSFLISGNRNKLYNGYYSGIIGGSDNIISGDTNSADQGVYSSFIIGSSNSFIKGAFHSFIIGGHNNVINHDAKHSTILNGNSITANTPNTVIVPQLRIASLTAATALTQYSLFADSNGYVFRKTINGYNGININNGISNISISFTGTTLNGINNGLNTYTGGTSSNPTVNISGATLSFLSAGTLSGGTIYSGGTDLLNVFVTSGITSGNGSSVFINKSNSNLVFKSLSAGTNVGFVDNGSVITISATNSSIQTNVQNGLNTYTGGTSSNPTVNISGATLSFLSAGTLSGGTIYSGGTNIQDIFVWRSNFLSGATLANNSNYNSSNFGITAGARNTNNSSKYAVILNGNNNYIYAGSFFGTVINGYNNKIASNSGASTYSFIGNGYKNFIYFSSNYSSILNGKNSKIKDSNHSAILNGISNNISGGTHSTIINGISGEVRDSSYSFLISGYRNRIISASHSIVGGYSNTIYGQVLSTILNGQNNSLSAAYSTILNGVSNKIYNNATSSFIGNGSSNKIYGRYSSIIGGSTNNITGNYSTIVGGFGYTLSGDSTLLVPKLAIPGTTSSPGNFMLVLDNSGYVFKTSLPSSGTATNVQNGLNTYTGGTSSNPTVNISGATLSFLSAGTLSGGTIYSGGTNIQNIFVISGVTSGNGSSVFINKSNSNLVFKSLSAGTNIGFVDNGSTITISATSTSSNQTNIQNGLNIYTGGTSSNPTVNISGATLSFLSAGTLSGGTIFSGGTNIQDVFVTSGQNISNSGTTIFIDKSNSILRYRTLSGASGTSISVNNNIITFSSPNIPSSAYLFIRGAGNNSIMQSGSSNSAIGIFSFIVGSGNTANANYSTVLNGKRNSIASSYGIIIGGLYNNNSGVKNNSIITSYNAIISEKVNAYNSIISSKSVGISSDTSETTFYNLISNSLSSNLLKTKFSSIIGSKSSQIGYYNLLKPLTLYSTINESLSSKTYSSFSNISHSKNAFILEKLSSGSAIINSYALSQTFIRYSKRSSIIFSNESYIDSNASYKFGYNNHIIASKTSYSYNSYNSLALLTKNSSNGYKTLKKQFFSGLLIGTKSVSNKSNKYGFALNSISGYVVFSATYSGLINSKNSNIKNDFSSSTSNNLLIINSNNGEVNSGKFNTLIGSLNSSIIPNETNYGSYNSIVAGQYNIIRNGNQNFIIGGKNNTTNSGKYSGIIGGLNNTINADYNGSVIVGGKNITLNQNYTVAVPQLRVTELPISNGYIIVSDGSGYLKNSSINSNNLFVGISNGTNTYTGGTVTNPRVNISAATLTFLSAGTLSGGTIFSGNTDLNSIFHKKNGYLLQKNGSVSGSTFTGSPLTYTLTFTSNFSNNNYAVSIVGEDARTWSVSGKTLSGFTIISNSSVALQGNVFWMAAENGEGYR